MIPTGRADRLVSLTTASAWAWGTFAFYAIACAWPEVGGWPVLPVLPVWVFVATCLAYGLAARRCGLSSLAGCAAGVLAAPMLRVAWQDNGATAACVGFGIAFLAMAPFALLSTATDNDGRLPAREAATLLWLSGCVAAMGGLMLADVVAWLTC